MKRPESNVTPLKRPGVDEETTPTPLVAWLRKQAAAGLDEMFGASPEKAYVRDVIELHAMKCVPYGNDWACGSLWGWDSGSGCHELFTLALIYMNAEGRQASDPRGARRGGFDPLWLPSPYRERLA